MGAEGRLLIPNSFQMPNVYVDLILPHLSGVEMKILTFVVRRTFGYNREEDHLPVDLIVVKTKVSRSQTFAALARLVEMGVLTKGGDGRRSAVYGLQLDPARFDLPPDEAEGETATVRKSDTGPNRKSEIPDLEVRNTGLVSPAGGTTGEALLITLNPTLNPISQTQDVYTAHEASPESELPRFPKPSQILAAEQADSLSWAALVREADSPPVPGTEHERWTATWRNLQDWAVNAGLDDAALAGEIHARARRYARKFTTPFTIPALGANWAALAHDPPPRPDAASARASPGDTEALIAAQPRRTRHNIEVLQRFVERGRDGPEAFCDVLPPADGGDEQGAERPPGRRLVSEVRRIP